MMLCQDCCHLGSFFPIPICNGLGQACSQLFYRKKRQLFSSFQNFLPQVELFETQKNMLEKQGILLGLELGLCCHCHFVPLRWHPAPVLPTAVLPES